MKSVRAKPELPRWPLRGVPEGSKVAARGWARAEGLVAAGVIVVAFAPLPFAARVAVIVALLVGFVALVAFRRRSATSAVAGWIVLDDRGVVRERSGEQTRIASWGARYGVTLLSNEARDAGVLAITSEEATRYIPVRARTDADKGLARDLFSGPAALTETDVLHLAPDDTGALSPFDATSVVSAIRSRDGVALERMVLSDPRGALVVLERDRLRAGDRVIDLTAALEWRAFLFVESNGAMASVIQATWVRQAGVEVVLVADAAREPSHPRGGRISHPDAPPPLEHRMAIERLFMAPLRLALDRAPRASRVPPPIATGVARAHT